MSYIIFKFHFRYIVYNTKYCYLLKKSTDTVLTETKEEETFPNLFYKANITFILNFKKVRKINGRPILINMNIKLIMIFTNRIQLYNKKIHEKVGLILKMHA